MDEQTYTMPDITLEQPLEVQAFEETPVEPAQEVPASEVFAEQVSEPSDTAQAAPTEAEGQVQGAEPTESTQEASTELLAACDSCGHVAELFEVSHHHTGIATMWHYCARCKAAHEKEYGVVSSLKELAQTHPAQADTPKVAGMLHQGMSVEEVKAQLDRERTPELEAEVVA